MLRHSFRQRVLLLAAMLVVSVQLLTLLPMLRAIRADAQDRALKTVAIGGAVFDEFVRGRTEQLRTTVDVLVSDFGLKQAFASGDTETIESALRNHSGRIGADISMLLDLDGGVIASMSTSLVASERRALHQAVNRAAELAAIDAIVFVGDSAYQILAVPLRAPLPIAWAVMGFRVDGQLAARMKTLTGMEISVIDTQSERANPLITSTLPLLGQSDFSGSIHSVELGSTKVSSLNIMGTEYLTVLRPLSAQSPNIQVALQLSVVDAMSRYRATRALLLGVALGSLLLAAGGAFWLARTVTEPVSRLVGATRRMREGDYSEPIETPESAELGELAGSFNAMQRAIAEREERIIHAAHHDSLTGLPNRERLLQELAEIIDSGRPVTVISFSLNRHGEIASSFGHEVGDEVLRLVADILRRNLREEQRLANVSGNEFILALVDVDIDDAKHWAEHMGHMLHAGVTLSGATLSLRGTAGIARYPDHGSDAADLLRRAAVARTSALAAHEPIAVFVRGDERQHRRQIRLLGDFPKAIANNQLRLFVQPKVSCAERTIVGAETLVRWQHPEMGLLMPSAFVDLIEDAGSISHLTRWVIAEAVRRCQGWRADGLTMPIAINLSVHDLSNEYLPYNLLELVKAHDLKPSDLTLEVTESAIMHNVSVSLGVLRCIREMGFGIALDDFGTGQSSLTQLRRLPVNELKIDKSFVMNMRDAKDALIVSATIELAHSFGLSVVAEGVESEDVLERLVALDCEYAQGYYISAPIPADAFLSWVHRWGLQNSSDKIIELRRYPADRA